VLSAPYTSGFDSVSLREITPSNRDLVEALRVLPEQKGFVDGVTASLTEAATRPASNPWCRGIYAGPEPVGFVMVAVSVPAGDEVIPWRHYLWRMLIDGHHQGRGYGRAALNLVTDYLRGLPDADELRTSVVPGPGSPIGFYLAYGFQPTGEWFDHEQVLRLPLNRTSTAYTP
jgi:diamine N-acetyltransferase